MYENREEILGEIEAVIVNGGTGIQAINKKKVKDELRGMKNGNVPFLLSAWNMDQKYL